MRSKTHSKTGNKTIGVNFRLGCVLINSFTAMFAAPSLGKRSIKMPNMKPSMFSGLLRESMWKDFYQNAQHWKWICSKDHQIYCLEACTCALFSPGTFTGWGSDRVNQSSGNSSRTGTGIAQWLERRTRDWKVPGSNPCRSGGRIFFSRVDFLCWL